ncbi:hypothetical protein DGWBC_0366 [Dehalogenimonas sp. WBC-2]|nr:hypothetical protein DGWBC_0366 [Dehalogenimonas sp. WBC-2]
MVMRVLGLILILAGIIFMYAAVINGQEVALFAVALVLGAIGSFMAWLGQHRMDYAASVKNQMRDDDAKEM